MYLFGEEMSLVDSNANYVQDAFSKLEFFVVQDIFFSHTCQFADVVLPAAPSLEKEGTFTSTERRIQRLYQVFEPLDGSRPDWKIIQDVANRLGANWNYKHPSEIMARDRIAHAAVRRRYLRAARRIQVTAMAGGRRRQRSTPALHQAVQLPGRQGQAFSSLVDRIRPSSLTRSSICISTTAACSSISTRET